MYTCELCGKQTEEGYMIVSFKKGQIYSKNPFHRVWIVCKDCGKSVRLDKKKF